MRGALARGVNSRPPCKIQCCYTKSGYSASVNDGTLPSDKPPQRVSAKLRGRKPPGAKPRRYTPPISNPIIRSVPASQPAMDVRSMLEVVLKESMERMCSSHRLFQMCWASVTPDDARCVLVALAAVRASWTREGYLQPFSDKLSAAFYQMCVSVDAPEVVVEALERAAPLGLLPSQRSLHYALANWGASLELEKLDRVIDAMPEGGLPFVTKTAYIFIRTAINHGDVARAERYAARFRQEGVRLNPTTLRLLEIGHAHKDGHQPSETNGNQYSFIQ